LEGGNSGLPTKRKEKKIAQQRNSATAKQRNDATTSMHHLRHLTIMTAQTLMLAIS
jgi:hypothetical protein